MNAAGKLAAIRRHLSEPLVLARLERGEKTAAEIGDELRAAGVYVRDENVLVYLARLRRSGLAAPQELPASSTATDLVYALTADGRAHLAAFREHWDTLTHALGP